MSDAFETFEHAGFTVELCPDYAPMPPSEWDTLGTMHSIGRAEWRGFEDGDSRAEECLERGDVALLVRYLSLVEGLYVLPFDVFEHGPQVTVRPASLSAGGCSGYLSTFDDRILELCGHDPKFRSEEWIDAALRSELGEWSAYLDGAVVGFVVRDERGEVVDSCWGFYPDGEGDGLGYVRQEARETAEAARDSRKARRLEVARGWALAHGLGGGLSV